MTTFAFIQNFSITDLAVVGFVIVLFFGAKRLPELFGSLGKSVGEFKRGIDQDVEEPVSVIEEEPQQRRETSKSL